LYFLVDHTICSRAVLGGAACPRLKQHLCITFEDRKGCVKYWRSSFYFNTIFNFVHRHITQS